MRGAAPSTPWEGILVAEMEETGMKIGFIALAVLVALALFAAPGLAAKPQLTVTWDGSGVTEVHTMYCKLYVQGEPCTFAGRATLAADGTWKDARGTFESTLHGEPILVRLKTADEGELDKGGGYHYKFTYDMPRIGGYADVIYRGTTYREIPYWLEFCEYDFIDFADRHFPHHYLQLIISGLDDCDYNGNSWHGWYISEGIIGGGKDPDQYIDWHWFT